MDITSSINSAFTQFHRNEQMTIKSNGHNNSNKMHHDQRQSNSSGQIESGHDHGPKSKAGSLRNAVHNAVAYDRSERGSLQLRTQEGDVVRIKFMNSESSNVQNQPFENGGSLVSGFSFEGSNESKFQVMVEGDLNTNELSAIRDVLIQAREIANSFFDGDVQAAFETASEFEINSEQLANANMRLSLSETYTYARSVIESQDVPKPGLMPPVGYITPIRPGPESTPVTAPVSSTPQTADLSAQMSPPTPAAVAPVIAETQISAVTPEIENMPPTPTHVAPDPVENLATALSTITDFLNQLTATLDVFGQQFQGPGSQSGYSISAGFQLQVVSSLVSQMEAPTAERELAGHTLAAATMDEVAMKMDAHVDHVV